MTVSPSPPSARNFGIVFFALFGVLAIYLGNTGGPSATVFVASTISLSLLFTAIFSPKILEPLNFAWFRLGLLLGKIVSPIVLGALFFFLLTPCALLGRCLGRDELKLKQKQTTSYWVPRTPAGPDADSFKNQF